MTVFLIFAEGRCPPSTTDTVVGFTGGFAFAPISGYLMPYSLSKDFALRCSLGVCFNFMDRQNLSIVKVVLL